MVLRDHRERTITSDQLVLLGLQHRLINVLSTCHRIYSTHFSQKLKFPLMYYKGTARPPLNPPTEVVDSLVVVVVVVLLLLELQWDVVTVTTVRYWRRPRRHRKVLVINLDKTRSCLKREHLILHLINSHRPPRPCNFKHLDGML